MLHLKRIIKFSWQGICRNKGLSAQAVFVIAVSLFVLTSVFFLRQAGGLLINEVEKKVDIAVYFKKEAEEEKILEIRNELSHSSLGLESVDYISSQSALDSFKSRHQGDTLYLSALEEVEANPFLASLNIKAENPEHYEQISGFLEQSPFSALIEKISYSKNKQVIEKLFRITDFIEIGILALTAFLALLVFLITFNTIKLTILSKKREIETSRLVGGSNWFISGPFIFQGLFYGLFSLLLVDLVFFVSLFALNAPLSDWLLNFNLLTYLKQNIFIILVSQLAFVFALGLLPSFLAVRKYLKI